MHLVYCVDSVVCMGMVGGRVNSNYLNDLRQDPVPPKLIVLFIFKVHTFTNMWQIKLFN